MDAEAVHVDDARVPWNSIFRITRRRLGSRRMGMEGIVIVATHGKSFDSVLIDLSELVGDADELLSDLRQRAERGGARLQPT
jgi:hypothetical protein